MSTSYEVIYTDEFGRDVLDVTDYYRGSVKAERCEANVMVLREGDSGNWAVSYFWLTSPKADLCQVLGDEYSRFERGEIDPDKPLFQQLGLLG